MDKDVKAIDTGGPAFPTLETEQTHPQFGMTLRDYFAASALPQALSASSSQSGSYDYVAASIAAYEIADAMLIERAKVNEGVA